MDSLYEARREIREWKVVEDRIKGLKRLLCGRLTREKKALYGTVLSYIPSVLNIDVTNVLYSLENTSTNQSVIMKSNRAGQDCRDDLFVLIFNGVLLLYNVVLVSFFNFSFELGDYRLTNSIVTVSSEQQKYPAMYTTRIHFPSKSPPILATTQQ